MSAGRKSEGPLVMKTAINGIAEHVPAVLNNMAHLHGEPAQILGITHRLDQMQAGITDLQNNLQASNNLQAMINGLQAAVNDLQATVNGLQATVNGLQVTVNGLQAGQQRLPIQLANLIEPFNGQLRYPLEEVPPWFPQTKLALLELTIPTLQAVANHLGLEPLPPSTLVEDRRRQITEFLGCGF
ncbi:hypothetical protein EDB83DRAFT_2547245 [Lactarius deliciosus]|nr:hypothetical protein EDB83DRAFT_2547245 [Lactarius deliciosus]